MNQKRFITLYNTIQNIINDVLSVLHRHLFQEVKYDKLIHKNEFEHQ